MNRRNCLTMAVLALLLTQGVGLGQAPLGTVFTYQGRVDRDGVAVNGTCCVEVGLWDAASGGNAVGGWGLCGVEVDNGLFTLTPDFGPGGFNGDARWLELTLCCDPEDCGNPANYTVLTPRQAVTPAPYAMYAPSLGSGGNTLDQAYDQGGAGAGRTITADSGAVHIEGSDGMVVLGEVGVGTSAPAADVHIAGSQNLAVAVDRGDQSRLLLVDRNGGGNLEAADGVINLDAREPTVASPTSNSPAFMLRGRVITGFDGQGQPIVGDRDFWLGTKIDINDGEARLSFGLDNNPLMSIDEDGQVGIGKTAPAAELDVAGAGKFEISTTASGSPAVFGSAGAASGFVFGVHGESHSTDGRGVMGHAVADTGTTFGVYAISNSTSGRGIYASAGSLTGTTYGGFFQVNSSTGRAVYGDSTNSNGYAGYFSGGRNYFEGNVGIGELNPATALDVNGTITATAFSGDGSGLTGLPSTSAWSQSGSNVYYTGGNVGIGTSSPDAALVIGDGSTTADLKIPFGGLCIDSDGSCGSAGEGSLRLGPGGIHGTDAASNHVYLVPSSGNVGVGLGSPTVPGAKLDVNGTTRTKVLEITGGSDIAEPFEVRADGGDVRPGMVVAIDPQHPGQLRVADQPYDATVAGIISGANGIRTGMTLKQTGTEADGSHPVALTGRVWCYCDAAAGGAIAPGDLLTSSQTPGHAMRVGDRGRATGAILGKALTSLDAGRGLVLVIVALQ